jgi:hypothetical protein
MYMQFKDNLEHLQLISYLKHVIITLILMATKFQIDT